MFVYSEQRCAILSTGGEILSSDGREAADCSAINLRKHIEIGWPVVCYVEQNEFNISPAYIGSCGGGKEGRLALKSPC